MELGASTLLISLVSWKSEKKKKFFLIFIYKSIGNLGLIRTFRNAFVGYFSIGFVLVPEIYNPLINN